MSSLKLYSFKGDFRAMKALIAAQYNGVTIERPAFNLDADAKSPEFLAKSPLGKVPVLETPEGSIFESNAIARYVARLRRDTNLYGKSFFDSAQVDSWVDFAAHELELPATMWVYPVLGLMDYNGGVTHTSKQDLKKALAVLEKHLLYRTYIVGDAVTLADIVTACALLYPMKMVMDPSFRKPYPSVVRWFITVVNQPQFAAVMGADVPLAEVELKAEGAAAGGAGGKAGKKGKKEKKAKGGEGGAAGGKKKKEKAEAKEEAAPAPKPAKKKGHFDDLPKSTMVLDVWKKTYANSRTEGYYSAMPKFWEMLDREGYSVWFCDYNYNQDNTVDFQTSNLVGGYVQRCDSLRKYSFGMMQIMQGPPFEVKGCWLLRGQSITPMMEENPDAEYYTWTKVDPDNEEQRKKVADLWCADEQIDGKAIYDCKSFF